MKNILIPIDFSKNAYHAFDYAYNLYGNDMVTYHLLYAYAIPVMASELAYTPIDEHKQEADQKMGEAVELISQKHPGADLKTIIEFGDLPTVIKKIEKEYPLDVIVMGTTGSKGIREVLFGSNTYDVVDNTMLPVFVVPAEAEIMAPTNAILSADFKPIHRSDLFDELKSVISKGNLVILNIKEETDSYSMNELMNFYDEEFEDIEAQMIFDDSNDIMKGIEKCAEDLGSDLIVTVKRKRNFLQDLFGTSVTRQMSFHSKLPLLVLHDEK